RLLVEHRIGYADLRGRVERAALACAFCGRSGLDVARLVTGPGIYLCNHCVEEASRLAAQEDSQAPRPPLLHVVAEGQVATCSFCGKHRAVDRRLVAGAGGMICATCLAICRDVLGDDGVTADRA